MRKVGADQIFPRSFMSADFGFTGGHHSGWPGFLDEAGCQNRIQPDNTSFSLDRSFPSLMENLPETLSFEKTTCKETQI
jgi:hypothetical protein